ncbi:MAG: hypothetical protein ACRBEE_07930 [Arenicella sp.]
MDKITTIKKAIRFVFLAISSIFLLGCMHNAYVQETFFSAIKLEGWKKSLWHGSGVYVFKIDKVKLLLLPTILDQEQVADS